jgi:hypothetical protein
VRVLISPLEIPFLIPDSGGTVAYTLRATNRDSLVHDATIWCDIMLPDSSVIAPAWGPTTIALSAGETFVWAITHEIPASGLIGIYDYNAYAVSELDTSKDAFMFGKMGTGEWEPGVGQTRGTPATCDWSNSARSVTEALGVQGNAPSNGNLAPKDFALYPPSPNPFNATTALSFQLPADSFINLRVHDTAGRLVETLVNGWREAGSHEVTFDASDLASGVYIYRLQARQRASVPGEFTAAQKMVVLK